MCACAEAAVRARRIRRHLPAQSRASWRHFLGSKLNQAESLFEEGQQLHGEQRFSEAAERWGRAALLQHAPSHAHLSYVLIDGRPGVAKDVKRGFELAADGAALGCAHSKGALGCCYVGGHGVAEDEARGLALGRESEAGGGQLLWAVCGWSVLRLWCWWCCARLCRGRATLQPCSGTRAYIRSVQFGHHV